MSSKIKNSIIGVFVLFFIAIGIYFYFYHSWNVKKEEKVVVTVPVQTKRVQVKQISKSISSYGTVIPAPGAIDVLSVSFECSIEEVMVNNGQTISKNDPLLLIQPSLNTYLSLSELEASLESANLALLHMRELRDLKLATNDQLLSAQLAYKQAKLRLDNMKKQEITGPHHLLSNVDGLIRMVSVQQGEIIPAGTPLVEIVAQNRFEIHLGIELANIKKLEVDQKVLLSAVYNMQNQNIIGTIRKLAYAVNPNSRLVDIFVSLPSDSQFLLSELVNANIVTESEKGMVVPRSAILIEGNDYYLFTVSHGYALKHNVTLGIQHSDEVLVISPTLHENDEVVILGNYELKNGVKVRVGGMQ